MDNNTFIRIEIVKEDGTVLYYAKIPLNPIAASIIQPKPFSFTIKSPGGAIVQHTSVTFPE